MCCIVLGFRNYWLEITNEPAELHAACTRAQTLTSTLLCTIAQMDLTLSNLHGPLSSTSANTSLALVAVITCNLHRWCFYAN